jgi:hypothetical protein
MFGVSATIVVSIATAVESTISVDSASFSVHEAVITPTNTSALIVLLISYVIILDLN